MSSCGEKQSGALSGEMAVRWAGLCAPALVGSGAGAQAWGQCYAVCMCEREREGERGVGRERDGA